MLSTVKFSSQLTDSLKISVFTSHDLMFFQKKELALIGISLHNPYFTEDRLITILVGFSHYFEQVVVLLADSIAIHNYQTMGYSDSKAQSKVRKHGNRMVNRINRAMDHVGQENICLVRWSEIVSFSYILFSNRK